MGTLKRLWARSVSLLDGKGRPAPVPAAGVNAGEAPAHRRPAKPATNDQPDTKAILKKIRRLELRTRRLVSEVFAGQYRSVFKGRGMNFEEVRPYMDNDEVRFIDRNVTARTGDLHIKKFTEERELTVVLMVDVSASGAFGSGDNTKRELAAELAAMLAFSAIRNQDKVGLILFSDDIELFVPPRKGRLHVLRIIREVLFFQPQRRGTSIAAALDYLNKVITRRSVVFLISDFQSPDFSRALSVTSRRHDLIAVPVLDGLEVELPDVGWLVLEDAETGKLREFNTSSPRDRAAITSALGTDRSRLAELLRRNRVDAITIRTEQDYLPALRAFFQQREKRIARR